MDPKEENGSKILFRFKDETVVDPYLKANEEDNTCNDEFIESTFIKRIENRKEELDQKESNLCLEESSYIWEANIFVNIQDESSDRNIDQKFNDASEIAAKGLDHSHECLLKSEIIEEEEIHIKDEEYNEDMMKNQKTQKHGMLYQCSECLYKTTNKHCFKNHSIVHKKPDEIDWYSCQECTYKACRKGNLRAHAEIHKSIEEKEELHKKKQKCKNQKVLLWCGECSYSTYRKQSFKTHSIRHKKTDEINWYCCKECPYKTYQKGYLKSHAEIHNNLMLKCSKCSYETLRPSKLKEHQIEHRSNVQWLHCSECSFKTHMPCRLRTHLLAHKKDAFKCSRCSYQSRTKQQLTIHQVKHESIDKWHPCPLCPYKTYDKNMLKSHCQQRHCINPNSLKQNEIFKCTECPYENGHKASVRKHQLIHDRSNWLQCTDCVYKTARKTNLKKHRMRHHGENAEGWHRCLECAYKTFEKSDLRKHVILHKSADEIRWFECSQCRFKTARKDNLRHHQMKHNEAHQWVYCYECTFKTKEKSNLVTHILWKHKKTR